MVRFGLKGKLRKAAALVVAAGGEKPGELIARATARGEASDWRRFVPETLAITAIVLMIGRLLTQGDAFASTTQLALWVPVGLMSAQYGLAGGVFATLCATLALYGFSPPAQSASRDFFANVGFLAAQPAEWLACALILGGLRNLHMSHSARLSDDLAEARERAETLHSGLARALREIERLERRIAGETSTVASMVRALAELDARDVNTLALSFTPLVCDGAGAASATLYLQTPTGVTAVARIDDGEAAALADAPRLPEVLIEALNARRGAVRRFEPEAARLLPGSALCAAPVLAGAGNVLLGVILIERLRSGQDPDRAANRTELLGLALGNILRGMNSRLRVYRSDALREIGG